MIFTHLSTEVTRVRLGETLVGLNVLSPTQLDLALARQADRPGRRLGEVLIDLALVSEADVARGLAMIHALPLVEVDELAVDPDIARLVPRGIAERWGILAYSMSAARLSVAVADPVDVIALDDIRRLTGVRALEVSVATRSAIRTGLAQVWHESEDLQALHAFIDENPEEQNGGRPRRRQRRRHDPSCGPAPGPRRP